jgi:hypothetical protein
MNEPERPDGRDSEHENVDFVVRLGLRLLSESEQAESLAGRSQVSGVRKIRDSGGNLQAGSLLEK